MASRKRSPVPGPRSSDFLDCVIAGFDEAGTKNLKRTTKIVWAAYGEDDVRAIGGVIQSCLEAKGYICPPLGGAFNSMREEKRTTLVSDLVKALREICV